MAMKPKTKTKPSARERHGARKGTAAASSSTRSRSANKSGASAKTAAARGEKVGVNDLPTDEPQTKRAAAALAAKAIASDSGPNRRKTAGPRGKKVGVNELPADEPQTKLAAAALAAKAIASDSEPNRRKPPQAKSKNKDANGVVAPTPAKSMNRASRTSTSSSSSGRKSRPPEQQGHRFMTPPPVASASDSVASCGIREDALRETHPTEGIRRRKFKVQCARPAPGSRGKIVAGAEKSRPTFSGREGISSRQMRGAPLFQPVHRLYGQEQRFEGIMVDLDPSEEGSGAKLANGSGVLANGSGVLANGSGVRRGGRMRMTIHSNLAEDKMASTAFRSQDEDPWCWGDPADLRDRNKADGEIPPRFRTSEVAPWGSGAQPLVKVELSLAEDRSPLSAERSFMSVVRFVQDRHRYSGEQLANVLTAEGILCYADEGNKVFVLTDSKRMERRETMGRVREVALGRCGVEVEVSPWLTGTAALDEFLGNHHRVIRHIVRHRLATGMWSEVGGVYFNSLFCGQRSRDTYCGVRLEINLAATDMKVLKSGVWELWITVEPAVYRFHPVDWWGLIDEKEQKGLKDFSRFVSDDLEERLQVLCFPNLIPGVVYDVKEDAFQMDQLQRANLKRGYITGPRSEDEMVEYWRQVHHINLPPTSGVFVKVRMGDMVLTYPSWCVVRSHEAVPEATEALRGRILDSFTDALDSMTGVAVKETTFSWHMTSDNACNGRRDAAIFKTAKGTAVWPAKKTKLTLSWPSNEDRSNASVIMLGSQGDKRPVDSGKDILPVPTPEAQGEQDEGKEGGRGDKAKDHAEMSESRTEASAPPVTPPVKGASPNVADGSVTMTSIGNSPDLINPRARSSSSDAMGGAVESLKLGDELMDEAAAAAMAARATLAVIRKSVIRRRGAKMAPVSTTSNQSSASGDKTGSSGPAAETTGVEGQGSKKICSTPFVIRRVSGTKRSGDVSVRERESQVRARVEDSGSQRIETGQPMPLTDDVGTKDTGEITGRKSDADRTICTSDTPQKAMNSPRPRKLTTPDDLDARTSGANEGGKRDNVRNGRGTSISKGRKRAKAGKESTGTTAAAYDASDPNPEKTSPPPVGSSLPPETSPTPKIPAPGPSKIQVTFSATGSLGMGLDEDDNEPGTVVLAGKSPTCAAAHVPDGWRITEVDGNDVRRQGGQKIASLLSARPVRVTFEAVPVQEPPPVKSGDQVATKSAKAKPSKKKPNAPPRKRGPSSRATLAKGKKAVTTQRKAFKVQTRVSHGNAGGGAP